MYDVEIKDLSVYYGSVCALQNIDLKIKSKEFLGIIGPNGGGKSTLLKVLLRLIKPTTGSISIRGSGPIGYVPQFAFFDRSFPINVLDVILMGKLPKKIKWFRRYSAKDINHAEKIMEELGILEFKNRQIKQLSGGQLQKVLIARALITDPKILLLDEPTSSLDSKTKKEIYEMINRLRREKTILIVTHETEDIFPYIDSIAYVNKTLKYYKNDLELSHGIVKKMYGFPNKLITKEEIIHRKLVSYREDRDD
ncbi:metal ABC transporter ATP-binding protein [Paramaledivibacter caminithermalis]|jgi:zinc transport system ATP-binding protein|uniref:Zinc transport system ATP-binding protein n=1 Tax=Paramaledivibacter caminithermalis (strain DSM 15212 / CIP 107654 / DViRD3) TaxID=1121301 RepID=A0A1M6PM60_PARC5|nr:ABC transporter ATP-binding protein [Paramaledivibacter caminithermalis]SHK09059.1 zinc transport system ATP-binding protein [Paramaledivibacter caminithermalis DSM 15212]